MELKVSSKMHEELLYAANLYQNARGVVAYCNRRTEDALIRRGLIAYTGADRNDNDPVITVAGWEYLASKGFNRRAEDPGRLTRDEALAEAYAEQDENYDRVIAGFDALIESMKEEEVQMDIDRAIKDRAPVRITFGHLKNRTGVLMGWNLQYDTFRVGFLDKDGSYSGVKTTVARSSVEATGQVNTYLDGDKLAEKETSMTDSKITPEVIAALHTLRNTYLEEHVFEAFNVLDNAGVFSAIDEATGYDVDPQPTPVRKSKCTCPKGVSIPGIHLAGCPGDPAEWGDSAYTYTTEQVDAMFEGSN